ncbi:MAG: heme-binding domain-containing protein [Sulfurovum sp.]|nr:heme-binding domain-containing protein [Sulfurovum sp.]MDD3499397.1 heme-binding domain-containing protein [Sulfurovum sp.]
MKKISIFILLVLIGIQFVPMDVPAEVPTKADDALKAPEEVHAILKRACFDCHSNHTDFPWYSSVAPVSWFTKMHVKEGREHMNFSTWASYDDEKKLKYLEKIPKAIKSKMPLPSYLIMHKEAKLSEDDKKLLTEWASEVAFDLE